tara:strand:- start:435 stop:920 length:486 start_codon:yes stop_codon:yes gene_type:complete
MADLTVTVKEDVKLNGQQYGSSKSYTLTGVTNVFKRVVTCTRNVDTTIVKFGPDDNTSDGGLKISTTKYMRITNLSLTEDVNLSFQIDTTEHASDASTAEESATFLLKAKQSFVMGTAHDSLCVQDTNATIELTLHDLESVIVDTPAGAEVDIEVFVASSS